MKQVEEYWLKKLSGELARSTFRYDFKESVSSVRIIDSVGFRLHGDISQKILNYCKGSDMELFKILTSGLFVLLGKYTYTQSGIKDIIIGSPIIKTETTQKVVNIILALRNQFEDNLTFHQLIEQVGKTIEEAIENKDYPLEELPVKLNMKVFGDDFPLFDVAITLDNFQDKRYLRHININSIFSFLGTSRYIEGALEYNASLFERVTVTKIIRHYTTLLSNAFLNINNPLYNIQILSEEEKEELLFSFNDTNSEYPKDKTIHELFLEQVSIRPDNTAVIFENDHLTYHELNAKADRLAYILRNKGVCPNKIVGVMVSRSLEMMIALLSVLKAGGAYVPIDPEYPVERIKFYLEDSETNILLTEQNVMKNFENIGFTLDGIDLFDKEIYNTNSQAVKNISTPNDLAYVIFTSGSTGKPKGVMIRHRNAINFIKGMTNVINFSPEKIILALTTVSFDIFFLETLMPMTLGLQIVIANEWQQKDPQLLKEIIINSNVTLLQATPSRLKLLLSSGSEFNYLKNIEAVLVGGEAFPRNLFDQLKQYYSGKIYDVYGPTETTVWSTVKDLTGQDEINIGRPIANTQIYILDKYLNLQPVGTIGELYIGGDGVARGYLNRQILTQERFIENPFSETLTSDRPYKELYQTGDLARWIPNGEIDFLGRIDHQVKIRGFRIETGEIEAQILKIPNILESVVIAREDAGGEKFLCAYFVSEIKINPEVIEMELSKNLLDYMIPAYFVQIESIPLTPNGKVDRKKLPDPKMTIRREGYTAPRDEMESKLVEIWAAELHMEKNVLSIDDNFFKMGGHSLKAAVVKTLIHKELDVKISMHNIFDMPTIRKLADFIKSAQKEKYFSIDKAPVMKYYPLISAQKRLYFMYRMDPNNIVYNIQLMDVYCKGIELDRLKKAFKKLIERHESLRTSFQLIEGEAFQIVHSMDEVISRIDIEYYETAEDGMIYSDQSGKEWTKVTGLPFQEIVEHFVRPFDLTQAPLIRAGLIKIWGNTQILMLDMHHIVSDGVSEVIIIRELWDLYENQQLPQLPIQFKDYAVWATKDEQLAKAQSQEPFWLNEFRGEISPLNLPTDFQRPINMTFDGDTLQFDLDKDVTERLILLAQEQGVTLYMTLLTIYNILLAKLSGQEEILIGTVAAGRGHADLQNLIGMFVDTLVLRNYPENRKTFKEFLGEVKTKTLTCFENQEYPFEKLVSKVAPNHDRNRNPLFDVAFALENVTERSEAYLLEVLMLDKSNQYTFNVKKSKFDMMLTGVDTPEGLQFKFEYNTSLFKLETIERFAKYYEKLVHSICRNMDQKIAEIDMISIAEKNHILYEFNNTKVNYPTDKTIPELFENCIEKYPDNVGLKFYLNSLKYIEINKKANQLAEVLRLKGVKPNNLIGIMVERSFEMIIGILGILKSGGAYLPVDPNYPEDRIHYLFKDSNSRILLTQKKHLEFAQSVNFDGEVINLDDEELYQGINCNLSKVNSPSDLAYIIYTSGSTGKPKGVMIEHVSAINLLLTLDKMYPLLDSDSYLLKTAFLFDVSVSEIFGWFWRGGSLVILEPGGEKNPSLMMDVIEKEKITHLNFVPSLFNAFVSILDSINVKKLSNLRYIFLAGEAIGPDSIKKFKELNSKIVIENLYGPTEATVYASWFPVAKWEGIGSIPIGKPVDNLKLFILSNYNNSHPRLQPIGVAGELTISGIGLARGYLNRPELTAEKFSINPFSLMGGSSIEFNKIYHTGDLTRWTTDGNIEYLGRIDFQVKVRGYRIELGEIENRLSKIIGIKEAIVVVKEIKEGDKYLCAYLLSENNLDLAFVREELTKELPNYMIPSYFIQIEKIPLNPSGKLDRKALPEPEFDSSTKEYSPPTNEIEKLLSEIWGEVLNQKRISIDENFFEIGGDSIKTILISARLLKRQLSVNVNEFYSNPTIRKLAKRIKKIEREIYQGPVSGDVELLPIHYWLFQMNFNEKKHFNHCMVRYSKSGFDIEIIKKVFTSITEHHDALRMVYEFRDNKILQKNRGINEGNLFDLEFFDLINEPNFESRLEQESNKLQRSINLQTGPLLKLGLFRTINGDYLLIIIHHAVVDGVSWRIIIEDFETAYQLAAEGKEIKFQDKTDSFKDWANKLKEYANSPKMLEELEYWKKNEDEIFRELPKDYEIDIENLKRKNSEIVKMNLSREETQMLLKEVNFPYNTEINDILLTALAMTLSEWSENNKVLITLEGHGREGIIEDIDFSRTIGWYTSQYPVLFNMELESTENTSKPINYNNLIEKQILRVKETLRRIPKKGIGYGILRYLTSPDKKNGTVFKLKPEVIFNYLGYFGE